MIPRPAWTEAETAHLTAILGAHLKSGMISFLADKTGRSVDAVRRKLNAMRSAAGIDLRNPPAIITPETEAAMRQGFAERKTLASIATALGLNARWLIHNAPRYGYAPKSGRPRNNSPQPEPKAPPEREKQPLPPCHPIAWKVITAGTSLEGTRPW